MKLKYCFLILILLFSVFILSGCYDSTGMESLAYVVAIGIDKGNSNNIQLTLQFATLNNSNSSNSNSSQATSSTTTSVECSTIDSGISLINGYISKKVNLAHCKAIIISEELANEGLGNQIFTLLNSIELRPDCNIIISKCDSAEFLKHLKLTLEAASVKYYELTLNSSEYAGYTEDVTLSDFYTNILSTTASPVAILGGINAGTAINNPEENYKASETPLLSENKVECMGLAVFKKDILVGELDNIQTMCHLIISNKLKEATVTINNPENVNSHISLNIKLYKPTKNKVKLVNGTPYIDSNIYVSAKISSLDKKLNLSDEKTMETIEKELSAYLKQIITDYLYTTSQKYCADIDGFGKHLLSNYLTWDDWLKSNWLENYKNSFFNISISSQVRSSYLYEKI